MNIRNTLNLSRQFLLMSLLLMLIVPLGKTSLVQAKQGRWNPFNTPQEAKEWSKRTRRFGQLWLNRRQRSVTSSLLQMLQQEPTPNLREAIVIALGRLEDPQAVKPLQELLARVRLWPVDERGYPTQGARRDRIPAFRIRLALGRIRARNLKGEQKLNAIAKSMGMTWPRLKQVANQLRAQWQTPVGSYKMQDSQQRFVVEEFYDVLYRMGKRGENIRKMGAFDLFIWSNDLTSVKDGLRSQEQAKLLAASLSDRNEIDFWLRRSLPPNKVEFAPSHLLDLGPQVPVVLRRYLQTFLKTAKANPKVASEAIGYRSMFKTAAATGDKRFIPLLREFQKINARRVKNRPNWMKIDAGASIEQLEKGIGLAVVRFP